jgi:hypothetical protein
MTNGTPTLFSGDSDRPNYEVVDITPDKAREMLTFNTHNRPLREKVVNALADDMKVGSWAEDGQSIKFGKDGTLLDGQHRLAAIVKADVTVRMLVVRNVPNDAQENMDTQARRSFGDVLKLRGEGQYVALAAATRRVYMWERGAPSGTSNMQPTNRQLLQTLEKHPELRYTVSVTERVRAHVSIRGSILSLCHWLFLQIDPDDCEHFFARLADGQNLSEGDAIYVLRRTANNDRNEGQFAGRSAGIADTVMCAYVIKAWNAYRQGRKIGLLRYKPGGAKPETFPKPE